MIHIGSTWNLAFGMNPFILSSPHLDLQPGLPGAVEESVDRSVSVGNAPEFSTLKAISRWHDGHIQYRLFAVGG